MFSIEQLAVLIGLFLLMLLIVVLVLRYSNKRHIKRLADMKEQLKKIEKAVEGYEKNGIDEKKNLLEKIQSLEKALKKSI